MHILTPAKINTFLHVVRKRPDGRHDVHLSLLPISIFDELTIDLTPSSGIALEVIGGDIGGPPEDNLVHRAAMAFHDAAGFPPALRIALTKNIPSGAGLGGGSGNAAGLLQALNALHGGPLAKEQIEAIARRIGADVPFFLEPRPMTARGAGDELTEWQDVHRCSLLVLVPELSIATADAYALVNPRDRNFPILRAADAASIAAHLENDFENTLFPRHPVLPRIKSDLLAAGAAGAMLSGSGSAVFGIFADSATRDRAASALHNSPWRGVWPCESLNSHDYLTVGDRTQG